MANYHRSAVENLPSHQWTKIETRRGKPGQIMAPSRSPRAVLEKKKAIKKEIFLIYYFKNTSRAYKIPPVKFISSRSINSTNYNFPALSHCFEDEMCFGGNTAQNFYVVSSFMEFSLCVALFFCHFYS